ncbi:MAG: DUF4302 domain-containing protein [Chitinophagaceae bacterium]|nr:DUF4302 domain-containing protein [Chitinophagaceae bacterium]
MKKIFLYILFVGTLFSSCQKNNDTVFDQSPDVRLNDALAKYQSALSGSPAGWNATIRTGNGGVYHFHFRFNESNRVFMFADIDLETATTARESSYRLKALQTPSLIFDTYSYLHMLADPDAGVNGGTYGQGLSSDFEFSLDSLATDSIKLTGRFNGTKLTLVKATQADLDAWQNGQWAKVLAFENVNKIPNYFRRITIAGVTYEVRVNLIARIITFTWVNGSGNLQTFSTEYNYNSTGIAFTTPFVNGSTTVNSLEVDGWDTNNLLLKVKVNGNAATIAGATQPLKIDLTAPSRWWQYAIDNGGLYWISVNGFTINGVEDAFGLKTMGKYYYLIYWPEYDPGNDLLAPVFLNAAGNGLELLYGAAPDTPTFTGDGRAIFTLLGNYGPHPNSGPAALTRAQLLIPQGYYFIQTSATTYDMVSASDAKAWVSWQF